MVTIRTEHFSIDVPTMVDEVTLGEYIDFLKAEGRYQKNVYGGGNGEKELVEAVGFIIKDLPDSLAVFGSDDDSDIMTCKEISVYVLYYHLLWLFNEYLIRWADEILESWDVSDDKKRKRYEQVKAYIDEGASLEDLHRILLIISEENGNFKYKKGKFSFLHRGQRFYVDPKGLIDDSLRTFTVGEVSKIKESRNRTDKQLESNNDAMGLLMHEMGVREVALICRGQNEKIPSQPGEYDKWLGDRMQLFDDIKMPIYFNVCFFLTHTLIEYGLSEITSTFSKNLNLPEKGKNMKGGAVLSVKPGRASRSMSF